MLVVVVGGPGRLLPARSVSQGVCVGVAMRGRLHQAGAVDTDERGNRVMPERQEDLAD